jgi:hypothetical protein
MERISGIFVNKVANTKFLHTNEVLKYVLINIICMDDI